MLLRKVNLPDGTQDRGLEADVFSWTYAFLNKRLCTGVREQCVVDSGQ